MDRGWRRGCRMVVAGVGALLIGALTACGGETAKRLPAGGPCDLLATEAVAKAVGVPGASAEVEGPQCFYDLDDIFSTVTVARGDAIDAMLSDESVELADVEGARLNTGPPGGTDCGVGVVLAEEDPAQRFGVIASLTPDLTDDPCGVVDQIATQVVGISE